MFWNASSTADDFEPHRYLPVVVDTAYTGTLAAHDATHPRIDLVCVAPAWESDVPESRNVKNPGTGVVSSTSIDARRRFSSAFQVVTGTPAASPAAPAVPAGYMEIGRAMVPASSGAAVWEDTRQVLQFGHFFNGLPRHAVDDYVPLGGTSELEVGETTPASLGVEVTRGRSSINGVVRFYKTTTLTLSAAHATLDRIDLVTAKADGTLAVVTGTPGASPAAPALPAASIPLAEVLVEATVTSVSNAKVTDRRKREPYHGQNRLQKGSTNHDRLDVPEVRPRLTVSDFTGVDQVVDIELFYPDGTTEYEGPYGVGSAMFEAELLVYDDAVASIPSPTGDMATDFTAGSLWVQRLRIENPTTVGLGDLTMWFKPDNYPSDDYNYGGGPSNGGKLVFWMPERTGKIKVRQIGGSGQKLVMVVRPWLRPGATVYANLVFP
jgi:hypothetical protein